MVSTMPHLLAVLPVRYFWDIPDGVVLLPYGWHRGEEEGSWYIKHGTLHYCWKQTWNTIEGTEDGFTGGSATDHELSKD